MFKINSSHIIKCSNFTKWSIFLKRSSFKKVFLNFHKMFKLHEKFTPHKNQCSHLIRSNIYVDSKVHATPHFFISTTLLNWGEHKLWNKILILTSFYKPFIILLCAELTFDHLRITWVTPVLTGSNLFYNLHITRQVTINTHVKS